MTEDIDDLQRECLKPETAERTLFVLGSILDQKKPYMNDSQVRVQQLVEGRFQERYQRIMGFQMRRT